MGLRNFGSSDGCRIEQFRVLGCDQDSGVWGLGMRLGLRASWAHDSQKCGLFLSSLYNLAPSTSGTRTENPMMFPSILLYRVPTTGTCNRYGLLNTRYL